jgi:hypothetical protein
MAPVNLQAVLFGGLKSDAGPGIGQCSVFEAALFAYRFFFRRFWSLVRFAWFPLLLADLLLYSSISTYLLELRQFIAAPNPRVASLALGTLAAGVFLALLCYAVAIAAISNLAMGIHARKGWLHFRLQRQEWRLYAGYLRFLLVLSAATVAVVLACANLAAVLPLSQSARSWIPAGAGFVMAYWLTARIAFLIPPLTAEPPGPIIRTAWRLSSGETARICTLMLLLLLPGLIVQTVGEYGLRLWSSLAAPTVSVPIAETARFWGQVLGGLVFVLGCSSFVSIVFLTAGAVAVRRGGGLPKPA